VDMKNRGESKKMSTMSKYVTRTVFIKFFALDLSFIHMSPVLSTYLLKNMAINRLLVT